MYLSLSLSLSLYLSLFLVRSCLLITLIKCLKGHKSLGSLFDGVFSMYLSAWGTLWWYFHHIELIQCIALEKLWPLCSNSNQRWWKYHQSMINWHLLTHHAGRPTSPPPTTPRGPTLCRGGASVQGGQTPISLEYQIYPPSTSIDTLVTGMSKPTLVLDKGSYPLKKR